MVCNVRNVRNVLNVYNVRQEKFIFQMPEKTSPFRVRMNPA